jgi:hypothetical protein
MTVDSRQAHPMLEKNLKIYFSQDWPSNLPQDFEVSIFLSFIMGEKMLIKQK